MNKILKIFLIFLLAAMLVGCELPQETEGIPLQKPILSIENKSLTWQQVENAVGYKVTVNGVSQIVTETSFNLSSFPVGEYTISVSALGDKAATTDSQPSTVIFSAKEELFLLQKPMLQIENKSLVWQPVSRASGYKVTLNGVSQTVTGTSYDLGNLSEGNYSVSVCAVGDGITATDSENALLTFTVKNEISLNHYSENNHFAVFSLKLQTKENVYGFIAEIEFNTENLGITLQNIQVTDALSGWLYDIRILDRKIIIACTGLIEKYYLLPQPLVTLSFDKKTFTELQDNAVTIQSITIDYVI